MSLNYLVSMKDNKKANIIFTNKEECTKLLEQLKGKYEKFSVIRNSQTEKFTKQFPKVYYHDENIKLVTENEKDKFNKSGFTCDYNKKPIDLYKEMVLDRGFDFYIARHITEKFMLHNGIMNNFTLGDDVITFSYS